MVRPLKQGLDYFALDIEMDDKVKLIDAKFGVAGFGVLIKVWQIIYSNSYYIRWTEKELLLYKNRINADINLINDVINECLRWDIFNNEIFEKYLILTSSGIQKRYFEAAKRRSDITLIQELSLIQVPQGFKPSIKLVPVGIIVSNNSKKDNSNTQSKVKRKERERIPPIIPPRDDEIKVNTTEERFKQFWIAYPRKTGKGAAEKVFYKLKPSEELITKILEAISYQKKSRDWTKENGQFIPHPSTWLNQKRWEDTLEPIQNTDNSTKDW